MTDAKAFIGWLDQQASVAKNRKIGTQGYCMGGPMAFRTAAAVPDRVGAVASFHGGGLVDDHAEQSASSGGEDQGAVPHRDRRERRPARAQRQDRAERDVREGEPARGDRSLHGRRAWLVPAGFERLQRAAGREGLEPSARAVRKSSGLSVSFELALGALGRPANSTRPSHISTIRCADNCRSRARARVELASRCPPTPGGAPTDRISLRR